MSSGALKLQQSVLTGLSAGRLVVRGCPDIVFVSADVQLVLHLRSRKHVSHNDDTYDDS